MISVLAWLLCQIAFVLLCQAMPRHAKQIWGKVLSDQQEIIRRRSANKKKPLRRLMISCWSDSTLPQICLAWRGMA